MQWNGKEIPCYTDRRNHVPKTSSYALFSCVLRFYTTSCLKYIPVQCTRKHINILAHSNDINPYSSAD